MQQANNFIVLNIREYLENDDGRLGEDKLLQFLSGCSCPLNRDVERFLKQQSVEFAKKHQAVTYLVLSSEDAELLGYFSITIKPLVVKAEPFSNTVKRKLARFSEIDEGEQTYNLAAYLIAQLGKNYNDRAAGRITGKELLEAAIRQIQVLQYQAGASPRKVSAGFRMKEEDYEKLKRFASEHNLTQTEAIEKGLDLLYQQYQEAGL